MMDTLMSKSFQSLQSIHPLAFSMPQGAEWIVIAALGLLLFGKRLPEVGKGMGQAILQFKKGLKGVEDDVEAASNASDAPRQIAEPGAEHVDRSSELLDAVLQRAHAAAKAPHGRHGNQRQDNWNRERDEPDQHPDDHHSHIGTRRPGR